MPVTSPSSACGPSDRVAGRRVFHSLEVACVERLCEDATAVTFAVPPGLEPDFTFLPGQFLTIRRLLAGAEHRRSYSVASAKGAPPRIGVREVPGGVVSGWLTHEVRAGDRIDVQPPAGAFTPDLGAPGRHVLIAAGSGITPVLSVATSVLADGLSEVVLIYGNRRSDSVMFLDEVADLKDAFLGRVQVVSILSREAQEAQILNGRIDQKKLSVLLPVLCEPSAVDHWWLCGPEAMVTDAMKVIANLGVSNKLVHRELFYVEDLPLRRCVGSRPEPPAPM